MAIKPPHRLFGPPPSSTPLLLLRLVLQPSAFPPLLQSQLPRLRRQPSPPAARPHLLKFSQSLPQLHSLCLFQVVTSEGQSTNERGIWGNTSPAGFRSGLAATQRASRRLCQLLGGYQERSFRLSLMQTSSRDRSR